MAKRVLITGGLSFIFSHVTQYLVKRGYEVIVVDNCSTGSHPEIVDGSFKFINKDLSDDDAYQVIIEESPHYIIHAAAITDVDFSIKNPRKTIDNNVLSTLNVFKGAKQISSLEKLLYVNSDEVYGECMEKKKEEDMLFPRNPYSASKAMGSFIRTSYDITYPEIRDKTAEIRMCNIFGERQDMTKIMPQIRESLRNCYSVPLQNEGKGYREYLYVKNVPPMIELVMLKGNRVYNITNNEGFTVNELIKISEDISHRSVVTHPATRLSHDVAYRMESGRIRNLGWVPHYKFLGSLKEYLLG